MNSISKMRFTVVSGLISLGLFAAGFVSGQPCVYDHTDHICLSDGSVTLIAPTISPVTCIGDSVTIAADKTIVDDTNETITYYRNTTSDATPDEMPGCPEPVSIGSDPPTYTVTWTATVGNFTTSGTGLTATFTPTDAGNGTVTFTCNYANQYPCTGTGTSSTSGSFTVVRVDSLAPDSGLRVTQGPDEPVYLVSYCPGSYTTVTASVYPGMSDADLPGCFQMSGGSAYTRTKQRVDRGQVGVVEVTATAGSSSKAIKVIVYKAIAAVYADSGDCWTTQHAWWELHIEPEDTYPYLKTSTGIDVSGELGLGGYYGEENDIACVCPGCAGSVVLGPQPIRGSDPPAYYSETGSYWWCVSVENLITALDYVRVLQANPGTYFINCNGSTHDCVTEAVNVCQTAGASINYSGWSACDFSDWLNKATFADPPFCDCY